MSTRALKILVVGMGIMLVAGILLLAATIAVRVAGPRRHPVAARPFVASPLEVPAGAKIETIGVGADRLVLALVLPDGNRQLLVIDLASGRQLGLIPVRTAP